MENAYKVAEKSFRLRKSQKDWRKVDLDRVIDVRKLLDAGRDGQSVENEVETGTASNSVCPPDKARDSVADWDKEVKFVKWVKIDRKNNFHSLNARAVELHEGGDNHWAKKCAERSWDWWPATAPLVYRPLLALRSRPGFFIIPAALSTEKQLELAEKCLKEYNEKPHKTNLSNLSEWEDCSDLFESAINTNGDFKPDSALWKLSWATTGYHYDWTSRSYFPPRASPMPPLFSSLACSAAEACGLELTPEASIINYYRYTSVMGGHQDELELTMDHPVVSFSIGNDAIFLLGGQTKAESPLALLLRSGDVTIMGGESRTCFHGIPRIIPDTCPDYQACAVGPSSTCRDENCATFDGKFDTSGAKEAERAMGVSRETGATGTKEANLEDGDEDVDEGKDARAMVVRYLKQMRININVRQVLPTGKTFSDLTDSHLLPEEERTRACA